MAGTMDWLNENRAKSARKLREGATSPWEARTMD